MNFMNLQPLKETVDYSYYVDLHSVDSDRALIEVEYETQALPVVRRSYYYLSVSPK